MSYQPHDPYLVPQTDPPTRSLPRRSMRDVAPPSHGPSVSAGAAVTGPQVQQSAELARRYELLERLGVPTAASQEFDELARDMASQTGFLYGFVNLFLEEQTFVGLHQPPADSGYVIVGRTMSREHGWCPEVMARKKALPLHDVHASPRFSGNHVVDAVGIRAYFGAPLIHDSGIVLGTVCVTDPEKRPLSEARRLRDIVINTGTQVLDRIAHAPVR
ncbi:GAF domain-containing protein [Streptomyces sp. NBC_00365]|uniref:GAF domain-containing protein n=1 Tax=Streptomyces sp. NBC_00365 TaxID=2975726 RepID=UPI00225B2A8E|nr:GAF domain-containing protein [Streptomyces sp. NBC_00365]MCX5094086.1 GAF domain-containing protein [Streptomyces sp. NBC_00365]